MTTIKDVAREAGLAVGTVSRIMNNRGYISEEARTRVENAVRKLNYQPNEMARSLQKKSSSLIGVIVPEIAHPYFASLISSLEESAREKDFRILLLNSQGIPKKEKEFMDLCYRSQVVGIILCNGNVDIKRSAGLHIPVITIERKMEGGDASIECDNEGGGRMAAEHLISRGCRHLLHISGYTDADMPAEKRGSGFEQACLAHELEGHVVRVPFEDYRLREAERVLDGILSDYPLTDGIFASDDIMAAEVVKACMARGIRIPEDMKIVGFDDTLLAGLVTPAITTLRQPIKEMAACAVDIILRKTRGKTVPARSLFPVEVVERATT